MKLRERGYSGDIWGMGGVESRNAGVRAEWNGERLQLLGLTEVFSAIPSILALRREMVERIIERAPEAVVVCDSPDYHMRLIAKLRARGYRGRIFYLSPPTVWAWRSGRANDLRRDVDECLPLFKFEHDYLLSRGCASAWRGHPLLEEYNHRAETPDLGVDYEPGKLVAFLPGSRGSEIKSLLPIMEEAASALGSMGWQPVFSVAPGLNPTVRSEMIRRFSEKGIRHYDGPGGALNDNGRSAAAPPLHGRHLQAQPHLGARGALRHKDKILRDGEHPRGLRDVPRAFAGEGDRREPDRRGARVA